jgi:hypothetical protein
MFSRTVLYSVKTIPCIEEKVAEFPFQRLIANIFLVVVL